MDNTDRRLVDLLRQGVPLVTEPYDDIGRDLGISGEEVISRIETLKKEGVIKRIWAWLAPRQAGSRENAMVVWKVPQERVEEVGTKLAQFKEVTHCIQRPVIPGKWPYNLYSMIHQPTRAACEAVAKRMSDTVGITEYKLIYSTKGSHPR